MSVQKIIAELLHQQASSSPWAIGLLSSWVLRWDHVMGKS
jgi:hypothetical protein